jgi:small subunit ribosomal protein S4
MKLFLKGDRCYMDKCAVQKRNYPPGQHGQARPRFSDYGQQLRETQKVKRIYGLLEKQFRATVRDAERMRGVAGENLLSLLERRLDNVVYRLGLVTSRNEARQLVRHGHFTVNDRRVNVPSARLKEGDVVGLTPRGEKAGRILEAIESIEARTVPSWLSLDKEKKSGEVLGSPVREELTLPMQEQLIVEWYSR